MLILYSLQPIVSSDIYSPTKGADIPPFNQMLLPLNEDPKTPLHFHFDDLDN